MKKINEYITTGAGTVALLLFLAFHSCNFLDVDDYFNETLQYDSIFHNKLNLQKYLFGAADAFDDEGQIFGNTVYTPGIMATDEAFSLGGAYNGLNLVLGEVTASDAHGINIYDKMYRVIRKANTIFARMNEATDLTSIDRREIMGYTYFLRAYAYYNLLNLYGPVVLLGDEVLENNEETEYYARYRNTYDECIDAICADLEKAADYLPSEVAVNFFGRPTRGAALGLIARLRLQHASPLFNGGGKEGNAARIYFGEFVRSSDNVHYIRQEYDERRWALAAQAAKRIIEWGIYSLHTVDRTSDTRTLPSNVPNDNFPNGAGNIDAYRSYQEMFNGETVASRNPEFLWACNSASVKNFTQRSFPVTYFRGYNNLCVTQKIVDAYYMENGKTIEEAKTAGEYDETGYLSGNRNFSGYQLGPNVHNMYINREMRFYASVAFSGTWWTASSATDAAYRDKQMFYDYSGLGGKAGVTDDVNSYPITGYILRKYIHPEDAWAGVGTAAGTSVLDKPFPIIRYAEILLSYVEALNNLENPYTLTDVDGNEHTFTRDVAEMKKYFDMVRYRAGLPGLTPEELNSASTMQALIERERMLEFMCENRRFFDVRRWGKYVDSENELMMGMDTEMSGDSYYTRVPLNHSKARRRVVNRKFVFMPIMLSELRKAPTLDQNPGWEN
ncbi:MAG: RagB/SusD family nutrient uptake outer membrane protein [Bacteroidales bacterium]|jgi:hypothetical protein|nr:RagB/SusD family nutrient uptake outer membrane protein [Bacteroidales bacterium]